MRVLRVYYLAETVLVYDNQVYSRGVNYAAIHVSAPLEYEFFLAGLGIYLDDLILVRSDELVLAQDHAALTSSVELGGLFRKLCAVSMKDVLLVGEEPHLCCRRMQEQTVFHRVVQLCEVLIRPVFQVEEVHVLRVLYDDRALELCVARGDELREGFLQLYFFYLIHGLVVYL